MALWIAALPCAQVRGRHHAVAAGRTKGKKLDVQKRLPMLAQWQLVCAVDTCRCCCMCSDSLFCHPKLTAGNTGAVSPRRPGSNLATVADDDTTRKAYVRPHVCAHTFSKFRNPPRVLNSCTTHVCRTCAWATTSRGALTALALSDT